MGRSAAPVLAVAALLLMGSRDAAAAEPGPTSLYLSSLPGGRFLVEARMTIPATPQDVRAVVTDYDHLASFMPKIEVSREESREGNRVVVHQEGTTSFILRKHIELTLEFTEASPEELRFRLLEGSFEQFEGAWRFFPQAGSRETLLHYRVVIRPGFSLPAPILRHVVRRDMEEMMPAIAREVARRGSASAPLADPPKP